MEQIDNLINTAIEEIEQQALLEDDATTTKKNMLKISILRVVLNHIFHMMKNILINITMKIYLLKLCVIYAHLVSLKVIYDVIKLVKNV